MNIFGEQLDKVISEKYLFRADSLTINGDNLISALKNSEGLYCYFKKTSNEFELIRVGQSSNLLKRLTQHGTSYYGDNIGSSFRNDIFKDCLKKLLEKDKEQYKLHMTNYFKFKNVCYIKVFNNINVDLGEKIDKYINDYINGLYLIIFDFSKNNDNLTYKILSQINKRNNYNKGMGKEAIRKFAELNLVSLYLKNNPNKKDSLYNKSEIYSLSSKNSIRHKEIIDVESKNHQVFVNELIKTVVLNPHVY